MVFVAPPELSFPNPEVIEDELKKEFPEEARAKAWDNAATTVKTYHDELVEQWQKAMDSLLTYAGLFSAVLTAFNVQSYQLLQPDTTDPMLAMLATLQQMSTQLNSFSISSSFINSTQAVRSTDQDPSPFRPPVSAIWINTLWFSSLVCSLASASIALMVKQWLYEASQGLSGASRETARLRQYRLNNLIKWKVGTIVHVPSVLLQVALFLFLAGLLILLWTIHEAVAAVITTLVGALFVFVVAVTILPIFRTDCCYRSPQALGLFALAMLVWNSRWGQSAAASLLVILRWLTALSLFPFLVLGHFGSQLLGEWGESIWNLLNKSVAKRILGYIQEQPKIGRMSSWNGAEQTEVAQNSGFLDRHIATMAYTTTFSTEHLKALHILLSDLPCDQVFPCFSDIRRSWSQLVGSDDGIQHSGMVVEILCGKPFYWALRKVLTVSPDKRDCSGNWTEVSSEYYLLSSYDSCSNLSLSREFLSTLSFTSMGHSPLAKQALMLLHGCFGSSLRDHSLPFVMTFDLLQDVMAMTRYNVEHWDSPDNDDIRHTLSAASMWLICTKSVLINHTPPLMPSELEIWIHNATRSLLSSLIEKISTFRPCPQAFPQDYLIVNVVEPLTVACKDIWEGYHLVPEKFLSVAHQILGSDERWRGSSLRRHLKHLESAIEWGRCQSGSANQWQRCDAEQDSTRNSISDTPSVVF